MLSNQFLSEAYAELEEIERQRIATQQVLVELQDKLHVTLDLMRQNDSRRQFRRFVHDEVEHPRQKKRKYSTEAEEAQQAGLGMLRPSESCSRSRPKPRTNRYVSSDDAQPHVIRLTQSALYFFDRMGAGESEGPKDTGTRVRNWLRTLAAVSDD